MRKRLLGTILFLVLSVGMTPANALAAHNSVDISGKTGGEIASEQVSSGDSGEEYEDIENDENIEEEHDIPLVGATASYVVGDWEYTVTDGIAVISKYTGTDASVTVPGRVELDGLNYNIRTIGANAFKGVVTMTSVTIPECINNIGAGAFRDCTSLSSITIEGNIADCSSYSIDTWDNRDKNNAVFGNVGANALSLQVTFGPNVTRIPAYLFATGRDEGSNVYAHITDLVIGDNVTEIGNYAFFRCYSLENITMGSKVTTIGKEAFRYNSKLNTVTLGAGVRELGELSFSDNTALQTVNCNAVLNTIGNYAFQNCSSLKNVNLNNALATIKYAAFKGCLALETITLPQSVTALEGNAFRNCVSLSDITINGTLADCSSYSVDTWDNRDLNNGVFVNAGTNTTGMTVTFGPNVTRIPAYLFASAREEGSNVYPHVSEVVIGDNVTEIGNYAFFHCYSLENITMGSKLTTIGKEAFRYNSKLNTVTLGAGVRELGELSFADNTALQTVNCNVVLNTIGNYAFQNCSSLENVNLNNALATIKYAAFKGCSALETITIPQSVTALGGNAFRDCVSLSNVTINGTLTDCSSYSVDTWDNRDLNNGVFVNAGTNTTGMTVTFGPNVTRIPAYLFASVREEGSNVYPHVSKVVIGDKVTEIGEQAFIRCYDLKTITMGKGLSKIGRYAFAYNTKLQTVTLGAGMTEIGEYAFYSDTALTTIKCNTILTTIGQGAFQDCTALTTVKLNSKLATIKHAAFKGCSALETITIPQSVTALGGNAFRNCVSLSNVTINGTLADCSSYSVDTWDNRDLNNGVFVNAGTNTTGMTVTFGPNVTRIPAFLFASVRDEGSNVYPHVSKVVIGDKVTEIGEQAFIRCYDLKTITMGKGLSKIGRYAFAYNTKLQTVTLGAGMTEIGEYAFYSDTALTTIKCNTILTTIGQGAFQDCTALTTVKLNSKLATIKHAAFKGCSALEAITIPQSVTALGGNAFRDCVSLSNVTINGTLADCSGYSLDTWDNRDLNNGVFVNAGTSTTGMKVTFGSKVTHIPAYLFATARDKGANVYARIASVTIPSSVKTIGDYAFYNCYDLEKVTIYSNSATFANTSFYNLKTGAKFVCYYGSTADTYAEEHNFAQSYLKPKTPVLTGIENAEKGVQITWKKPIGAKGYYIYRSTGSGKYTLVGTVKNASTLKYVDQTAKSGKSYKYKIKAYVTSSNTSDESNICSIKYLRRPDITQVINNAKNTKLSWTKVSGASGYTIYRKAGSNGKYTKLADITSASKNTYTDNTVQNATTYYYKVVANAKSGSIKYESFDSVQRNVYLTPTNVSSVKTTAKKTMTVKWKKVSKVGGYQIEYSTKKNFDDAVTKNVTGAGKTSQAIKDLKKGKTYYVRIRTFKKVSGTKYYSSWSSEKKVKITK